MEAYGVLSSPKCKNLSISTYSSVLGLGFYGKKQITTSLCFYKVSSHLGWQKYCAPAGHSELNRACEGWRSLSWKVMASEAQMAPQTCAYNVDELRDQLEALQEEADQAAARANSARARFMRLTDAVEQLRLRAALDVKAGDEDSARRLLHEKRNVMKALELSKKRGEVLEELCSKLREAISRKESEVIAALSCASLNLDAEMNDSARDVRVVSPKYSTPSPDECTEQDSPLDYPDGFQFSPVDSITQEEERIKVGGESDQYFQDHVSKYIVNFGGLNSQESMDSKEGERVDKGASYKTFMLEIDHKIAAVEEKLKQFMDVAEILLEVGVTTTINERVETVQHLLQHVQDMRTRIHSSIGSNSLLEE